jgi:hypothetical protein
MVRNWMLIVGLSLGIAALGCSDDDSGTGGSAGMGGSGGEAGDGGDGGTAGGGGEITDACTNAEDAAKVCDENYETWISDCATEASGDGEETSACLQMEPASLSADCADCAGAQVECVRDNCVFGEDQSCLPPVADQAACDQCQEDAGCNSDYDTCAGMVECAM